MSTISNRAVVDSHKASSSVWRLVIHAAILRPQGTQSLHFHQGMEGGPREEGGILDLGPCSDLSTSASSTKTDDSLVFQDQTCHDTNNMPPSTLPHSGTPGSTQRSSRHCAVRHDGYTISSSWNWHGQRQASSVVLLTLAGKSRYNWCSAKQRYNMIRGIGKQFRVLTPVPNGSVHDVSYFDKQRPRSAASTVSCAQCLNDSRTYTSWCATRLRPSDWNRQWCIRLDGNAELVLNIAPDSSDIVLLAHVSHSPCALSRTCA
jgi:hypothetical protein